MSYDLREHPEIEWAHRTGYPSWNQPKLQCCSRCGEEIDGDVYEDDFYEYLCEPCLLSVHKKEEW